MEPSSASEGCASLESLLKEELSSGSLAALQEFLREQEELQSVAAQEDQAPRAPEADSNADGTREGSGQEADGGTHREQGQSGSALDGSSGGAGAGTEAGDVVLSAEREEALFRENWKLSQFWYEEATAEAVASEVLRVSHDAAVPVACVACPTLFRHIRRRLQSSSPATLCKLHLLEYDRRFAAFGHAFTFYDYNHPLAVPQELQHHFAVVVADPPYLSQECLEKTAATMRLLVAQPQVQAQPESHSTALPPETEAQGEEAGEPEPEAAAKPEPEPDPEQKQAHSEKWRDLRDETPKLLLLTGFVMQAEIERLLGLRPCKFRPQHKSKLGNEFGLFTSYEPPPEGPLGGWETS